MATAAHTVVGDSGASNRAIQFCPIYDCLHLRSPLKGRDANLKGGFDLYFPAFKRKVTVKLLQSEHGVDKTWIAFKTKS